MTAERSINDATCLVTGGAGFLGRALVRALRARGCPVVILDLAPAGFKDPGVRQVRGDLCDPAVLDDALRGVDVVFHCAALMDLAQYAPRAVKDRVQAVNVDATRALLTRAEAAGASRFVLLSSIAAVLGNGHAGAGEEQPYSTAPNLYTTSKIAAERLVRGHVGRLQGCALRPGGIYGPGERNQIIVPSFQEYRRGGPVTVIGEGTSRIDYTHVDNLVDACLRAAERLYEGSPVARGAYFISDGQPINHGEWMLRLLRGLGMAPKVRYVPAATLKKIAYVAERAYERLGKKPPITLALAEQLSTDAWYRIDAARRDLGYAPRYDTDAGLRSMHADIEGYLRSIQFRGF